MLWGTGHTSVILEHALQNWVPFGGCSCLPAYFLNCSTTGTRILDYMWSPVNKKFQEVTFQDKELAENDQSWNYN